VLELLVNTAQFELKVKEFLKKVRISSSLITLHDHGVKIPYGCLVPAHSFLPQLSSDFVDWLLRKYDRAPAKLSIGNRDSWLPRVLPIPDMTGALPCSPSIAFFPCLLNILLVRYHITV